MANLFELLGMTPYLVGKLKFKLFFQGPLAECVCIGGFCPFLYGLLEFHCDNPCRPALNSMGY